jgi:hypothetical protein
MKNKIKEVQDYFKNKIVAGDYEVIETTEHFAVIEIDSEYIFCLWLANGHGSFSLWENKYNFIDIVFDGDEKILAHEEISPQYKKFIKTELILQKRKELEELEIGLDEE